MKNIFPLVLSLFVLFTGATATAQTARTIEVTVLDTVFLKTSSITYMIVLNPEAGMYENYEEEMYYEEPYEYEYEYKYNEQEPENREKRRKRSKKEEAVEVEVIEEIIMQESIEEAGEEPVMELPTVFTKDSLVLLLEKQKFDYSLIAHENYVLPSEFETQPVVIMVTMRNEEELKSLVALFEDHPEITGKVKKIELESVAPKMNDVYKDLYAKAVKEAQMLASAMGGTVGKVIKVTEHRSEFESYLDNYQEYYSEIMENMPFSDKDIMNFSGKDKIIHRTFIFELR